MTEDYLIKPDRLRDDEDPQPEKVPIKILIYTDDPSVVKEDHGLFGIGTMRSHLTAHEPAFAKISVSFVSRNSDRDHHADNKLDAVLDKERPDQIWFFGIHQINKPEYTLGIPGGGGPSSELDANELLKLEEWMSVGGTEHSIGLGVLMTGDHANPHPDTVIPEGCDEFCPTGLDHKKFLCLGRAIGHAVPRAGKLREWIGPPTRCVEDNFNTQVLTSGSDIERPRFQIDDTPQKLMLETFDAQGNPLPDGEPHPLFRGKKGRRIDVFPDHMHEGAVIVPKALDPDIWPRKAQVQPAPREVAFGTNKRNGHRITIAAAYDGDSVDVGRIVADSTWHHYLNINLTSFPPTAPAGSPGDLIGQFYSNLAIWLCPLAKRRAMGQAMFRWLATHPLMLEEVGSGPLNVGGTAYGILAQMASQGEINELFQATCPNTLRRQVESIHFPDSASTNSHLPSKQLILGSVINEYHRVMAESYAASKVSDASIIERGFSQAFVIKTVKLLQSAAAAVCNLPFLQLITRIGHQALAEALKPLINLREQETTTMSECTAGEWTLTLRLDKNGEEETFTFDLTIDPRTCRVVLGVKICEIEGKVLDARGRELSRVRGRCRSTTAAEPAVMDLDFHLRSPGVGITMAGLVFGGRNFAGAFRAYNADGITPPPLAIDEGQEQTTARPGGVEPETGDTGTGTGSATLVTEGQQTQEKS
jgi:hypothetical protein